MKGTPPTISEAMPPVVCWPSRCLLLIFISIQPPVGGLTFTEAPMAGGSVRGTVVDSVTGAAVARARVRRRWTVRILAGARRRVPALCQQVRLPDLSVHAAGLVAARRYGDAHSGDA